MLEPGRPTTTKFRVMQMNVSKVRDCKKQSTHQHTSSEKKKKHGSKPYIIKTEFLLF